MFADQRLIIIAQGISKMTTMAKAKFAAACAALIAAVALAKPALSQQPPAPGHPHPQAAPVQPGTGMGQPMQHGMDRGQPGQGLGTGMMQRGVGQGMAGSGMMSGAMMPMMMGAGAGHTEGRLAFIKAELKITDAQMPQWNAFADAVRANASAMHDMHRSMASQQKSGSTLPERLAMEDKVLSAHVQASKKIQEPLTKLYDVLGPEQKKLPDGIVIGPMGMPMGMM
jgi:hypothetical protein